MVFTLQALVLDFAMISCLLFLGQLIRSKVKFVQSLFLPAPLIAGGLGLLGGESFLGILPFSEYISTYSGVLIVILFAGLRLGVRHKASFKAMFTKVSDVFLLNLSAEVGQFGVAMLIGTFLMMTFFPQLHEGFALLLPAGFVGGHGYASVVGGMLEQQGGWAEAITVGQTFATIGLLVGIIVGVIMINIAIKTGQTTFVKETHLLPKSMRTGWISRKERESVGSSTTHSISIDAFTWHIALLLMATGGGYLLEAVLKALMPQLTLPLMSLSMISGIIIQRSLKAMKLEHYVDRQIINHAQNSVTDYMVAFGIAAIDVQVVRHYAVPIFLLTLLGLSFSMFYTLVICKKLFKQHWFEQSIFIFGWMTGVVSVGIILLRMVDPDMESNVLDNYGIAYAFIALIEIVLVSGATLAVLNGYSYIGGGLLIGVVMLSLIACHMINRKYDEVDEEERQVG